MKNGIRALLFCALAVPAMTYSPPASAEIFFRVTCYFADGDTWWGSTTNGDIMYNMVSRCRDQGGLAANVTYAGR